MRHAICASAGTLFWAALLACYLNTKCTYASTDNSPLNSKSDDSSPQVDDADLSKRDWKNLRVWGKRGWGSLHGGWGLKRDQYPWESRYSPNAEDKRAWQNLQGGWGKRYSPDDEYAIQQLASLLEEQQYEPQYSGEYVSELDFEPNDMEKRSWKQFNGGWGKRGADQWRNFKGSWGKREPAWTNLKGIWGKRSMQ